jgi:type VI protein secretion system component VasF
MMMKINTTVRVHRTMNGLDISPHYDANSQMNRKRIAILIVMLVLMAAIMLFWSGGSLSRHDAEVALSASALKIDAAVRSYPRSALR